MDSSKTATIAFKEQFLDYATGFLDLPTEVRNMIYELRVLLRGESGERRLLTVNEFEEQYTELLPLTLSSTQIRRDMLPMFFGDNLLHLIGSPIEYHLLRSSHGRKTMLLYSTLREPKIPRRLTLRQTILELLYGPKKCIWHGQMELPPPKWRHLSKHIRVTLHAPPS